MRVARSQSRRIKRAINKTSSSNRDLLLETLQILEFTSFYRKVKTHFETVSGDNCCNQEGPCEFSRREDFMQPFPYVSERCRSTKALYLKLDAVRISSPRTAEEFP